MDTFISKVKAHKIVIGTTIGVAAALGILLFLSRKRKQAAKTKGNGQESKQTNQNEKDYLQKARKIGTNIHPHMIGKKYDMNTISQVLEQSIELAAEEYIQATLKNRQERRKVIDTNIYSYQAIVFKHHNEIEDILKKAQDAILDVLNIKYEDFESSLIENMEKGHYQEIEVFQAGIRQKIKEKIKGTKNINIQIIKEIYRFQIVILKQPPELLKQAIQYLSEELETIELIPLIINNLLNDFVFQQFQIEEEDQIKIIQNPELSSDNEFITILQEMEQAMFALIVPLGPEMGQQF